MDDFERLLLRLELNQKQISKQVEKITRDTSRSARRMERNYERATRSVEAGFRRVALRATSAIVPVAGLGTALLSVARNGDRIKTAEARFRALGESANTSAQIVNDLSALMVETGGDFDGASSAFTRFLLAGQNIGATADETFRLTEVIQKLGVVGGSTTQELTSGSIQLAQGLASGRLQGEELRSVLENLPLVAQKLAEALGVGVGELRRMGAEGELTGRRVFDALLSKGEEASRMFSTLPVTLERATGRMAAAWERFSAKIDDSIGLSRTLAGILNSIADGLDRRSLVGRDLLSAQIGEAREELQKLRDEAASEPVEIETGSLGQSLFGGRLNRSRKGAFDGRAVNNRREKQLMDTIKQLEAAEAFLAQADARNRDLAATAAERAAKAKREEGFATAQSNLEREREIALMDQVERRVMKAGEAAEASFLKSTPGATTEQIANIRAFAEETERLAIAQQAASRPRRTGGGGGSPAGPTPVESVARAAADELAQLRLRAEVVGQTVQRTAELEARQMLLNVASREGKDISAATLDLISRQAAEIGLVTANVIAAEEAEQRRTRALEDSAEAQKRFSEEARQGNSELVAGLLQAASTAKSFEGALKKVALQLVQVVAQQAIMAAFGGPTANNSVGSFFSLAFGGLQLFRRGGYTGNGATSEAAGIVHKREYVLDARTTKALGGPKALDGLLRGRGLSAPSPMPAANLGGMGAALAPAVVNGAAPVVNVPQAAAPQVILLDDPARIGDYLNSPAGEAVLVRQFDRQGVQRNA